MSCVRFNIMQLTTPVSFVTTTVVNWVDVFTRTQYKDILVEALRYCQQNKGLELYAWVLMTNHIHLVAGIRYDLHENDYDKYKTLLSAVIRDFKKYTSKKLVEAIMANPQESRKEWMLEIFRESGKYDSKIKDSRFWNEGFYMEEVYTMEFLQQKVNYIHQNPVKQGMVARAEDYPYSSGVDYAGGKGLLEVIPVRFV